MSITMFLGERVSFEGELPVDPDSPRHRVARLDEQVKLQLEAAKRAGRASDILTANLFEDATHNLVLEEATAENGAEVHRGRVDANPDSRVVLTSDGETITVTSNTGNNEYQVVPLTADNYLIEEVSLDSGGCATGAASDRDSDHDDGNVGEGGGGDSGGGEEANYAWTNSATAIAILLLFTPSVKTKLGGDVGLNAFVRTIFANLNTSLLDSKTGASANLAALIEADLLGIPDNNCDTTDFLAQSSTVQGWRRQYKADLVSIIRTTSATSCADCLTTLNGRKSAAYSSVNLDQARQRHSFSHEIGHNLGCAHDRANSTKGCAEDTGRGYRFDAGGKSRGTLMAYGKNRVNLFSSPEVLFMNVKVGTDRDNNSGTIKKTAPKVVEYGEALEPPSLKARPLPASDR